MPEDGASSAAVPMDAASSAVQNSLTGDDSPVSTALAEDNESGNAQDQLVSDDNSVAQALAQEDGTYVEDSGEGEPQDVDGNVEEVQEEEPTEPAPEPEPAEEVQQRQPTQQERVQNYQTFVSSIVDKTFSKEAVDNFGAEFYRAMGVDVSALDDYDAVGEYVGQKSMVAETIPKIGRLFSSALVDGVASALPALLLSMGPNGQTALQGIVEQAFPGFAEQHSRALYQSSWDKVAAKTGCDLEYGSEAFRDQLNKAGRAIKGFDALVYKDRSGRALPFPQQVAKKYELLARAVLKSGGGRRSSSSVTRTSSRRPAARPTGDRLADFITESNSRSDF